MPKSAAELRAHLAEIDEEIIQQGQVLRQLHESRFLVQSQLDSILVYPVLTLPVEITAEIFLHCLPDKNAKVSLIHAPFVLLKVCTRWRDIALSTPRLWATLDVNVVSLRRGLCPGAPSSSCEWTRLAFDWLFRARKSGIPWSVTLRHPSELHGDSHKFQPDLDFLRDIGLQLESLEVYGLAQEEEGAWDPYESRNFTPGSFPLLKCLTIGPAPPERDLDNHWLAFFNDAPQLRQLNLGRILGPIENNSPFPWHQLTTFSGHDFHLELFLDILRLAPELECCRISVTSCGLEPVEIVTHARLQKLTVCSDSDGVSGLGFLILDSLILPALESLHVSQITQLTAGVLEDFLVRSATPLRSAAPLRSLALDPNTHSFYGWEEAFRLIPDLEELHLGCRESEFQAGFLEVFSSSEDPLLPKLRRFYIHRPSSRHGDVRAALEKRRRHEEDQLSVAMMLWAPEDAALPDLKIRFI